MRIALPSSPSPPAVALPWHDAQDACLTGDSTLADQRALAALADATEAACPCAEPPPAARRTSAAPRRVLATQRSRPARCARMREDRQADRSRHVVRRRQGAVRQRSRVGTSDGRRRELQGRAEVLQGRRGAHDRTRCTDETSCDDVVTWTAGTCFDPRDEGPYAAGVRVISWTKDSASSPGHAAHARHRRLVPGAARAADRSIRSTRGVVDAPLDASGGPYPVVLFSHGSCGYPLQSTFLTPLLASRGFIVVAPPHPGNTIYEFPTCGTPNAQAASFIERPTDMIFVLDQILAAGAGPVVAVLRRGRRQPGGDDRPLVRRPHDLPRRRRGSAHQGRRGDGARHARRNGKFDRAVADHARHHRQRREQPGRRAGLRGLVSRRSCSSRSSTPDTTPSRTAASRRPTATRRRRSRRPRRTPPCCATSCRSSSAISASGSIWSPLLGPPTGPGFVYQSDL